jgi:serine/threonine protein kinase
LIKKYNLNDKFRNLFDIAKQLEAIHDLDLVHGNLHDGNILCVKSAVMISDYGLCRPVNQDDKPVDSQGKPNTKDDEPVNQQEQPNTKDDEPVNQQEQPNMKNDEPVNQQEQPNMKDDEPVDLQGQPNMKKDKSATDSMRGVIPYMAPEILSWKPYTKAADIYSFGIIMWEMTSGVPAFHNVSHDLDLILNIIKYDARPKIIEGTMPEYVELMEKCWNKDPEKRPTARELKNIFYDWNEKYPMEEDEEKRIPIPGNHNLFLDFKLYLFLFYINYLFH